MLSLPSGNLCLVCAPSKILLRLSLPLSSSSGRQGFWGLVCCIAPFSTCKHGCLHFLKCKLSILSSMCMWYGRLSWQTVLSVRTGEFLQAQARCIQWTVFLSPCQPPRPACCPLPQEPCAECFLLSHCALTWSHPTYSCCCSPNGL